MPSHTEKYDFPIDLVYLWCDGADPDFAARKAAKMKEFNPDPIEDNVGAVRYVQHDELRYSLRSAFKNVQWVRHIFIVTDNQRPKWLSDHPKITIIDHKDIIPAELLPTFSSVVIEMYLDRIPGLSEHFIYANDDIFFSRPIEVSDFFDQEGRPVVYLDHRWKKIITESVAEGVLQDNNNKSWEKTVMRAWMLHMHKRGIKIPFYRPSHSFDAYTKTMFRKTLDAYPELKKANSAPLRTGDEISRVLFSYEMMSTFKCPVKPHSNAKTSFLGRLRGRFFHVDVFTIIDHDLQKLKRNIRDFRPKTFCFNNIESEHSVESMVFLKSLYPDHAPWEKD